MVSISQTLTSLDFTQMSLFSDTNVEKCGAYGAFHWHLVHLVCKAETVTDTTSESSFGAALNRFEIIQTVLCAIHRGSNTFNSLTRTIRAAVSVLKQLPLYGRQLSQRDAVQSTCRPEPASTRDCGAFSQLNLSWCYTYSSALRQACGARWCRNTKHKQAVC